MGSSSLEATAPEKKNGSGGSSGDRLSGCWSRLHHRQWSLLGTEISIGVDSALNVALEAIDRIKRTASSHHRAFLVEVMGRSCGTWLSRPESRAGLRRLSCRDRHGAESRYRSFPRSLRAR